MWARSNADALIPVTPIQQNPPNSHLQTIERLPECRECRDRFEVKGATNTRHLDEFVKKITIRGRLLHLEAEQDDVLSEDEFLPQITSREPRYNLASRSDSTFNELEES